jgi:hypothetical protein
VDTISLGPGRDPGRGQPGWRLRHRWPGRWAWLVIPAAAVAVAALVLVTTRGHPPRTVSVPGPSAQPLPPLLAGVPARGARPGLVLGGENFWQAAAQPRAVAAGFLVNGLSPLLPPGHGAEADQLAPVPGGVVAHIGDTSTGVTYGALGRVVFLPADGAPARFIARATMIAVSPGGQRVWVQTAVQSLHDGEGAPASFQSPTWAVDLAGRRVSPVLRLPFGLVAATGSGPLTQNLVTGQLQLWNGATGRPIPLPPGLPADANFVAAGRDRVVWYSCAASCLLHVTDLDTGAGAAVPLPRNWLPPSETYPPPPASFDPSGQQLVLPLDLTGSSGTATAEDLFVADLVTRTLRMIPGQPQPPASALIATPPIELAGAWDRQGLLWVLATNPDSGYYQLGSWTGDGPLRTLPPAPGSPTVLSPPGPG